MAATAVAASKAVDAECLGQRRRRLQSAWRSPPWLHQRETDMCVEFTTDNVSMAITAVAASKELVRANTRVGFLRCPWRSLPWLHQRVRIDISSHWRA